MALFWKGEAPLCPRSSLKERDERPLEFLSPSKGDSPQNFAKDSATFRYVSCFVNRSMQDTAGSTLSAQESSNDIVFACTHCSASFVVDAAAAGLTLDCQKCGKPTTVPNPTLEAAAENCARVSDLQRQLKENESQRTEITGYINQLSIQLHRWQLRLQTLKEREQKLQTELAVICGAGAKTAEAPPEAATPSAAQSSG
jgi:transcription elongation factor Elf1